MMSIAKIGTKMPNITRCLIERKKHGEHRQKDYHETYGKMVKTAKKQLIENVRTLLKLGS